MPSLGEAILVELKRNRELLAIYQGLPGNAGMIGASFITEDIEDAERALAENDVIAILQCYEKLKGNE